MLPSCLKRSLLGFSVLAYSCSSFAEWSLTANAYVEIEEFKDQRISGEDVYDKLSSILQLSAKNPESDWRYFFEVRRSIRNYTTSFESRDYSYNRDRVQLQATRNLYKSDKANLALAAVYRYEDNDNKLANSYDMYWFMPSGAYKFTDKLSFTFWDGFYYYDNKKIENGKEWESEHGLEYKVNDQFTAKFMFYTDRTWDVHGNKTWAQNQIRGYFPTKLNDSWEVQPYFRYFINEKTYNPRTGKVLQRTEGNNGGRLGIITGYNLSKSTTIWTNFAYENTKWRNPKPFNITNGDNNTQDFALYSLGVRHTF
jgi:outer membrane protein G